MVVHLKGIWRKILVPVFLVMGILVTAATCGELDPRFKVVLGISTEVVVKEGADFLEAVHTVRDFTDGPLLRVWHTDAVGDRVLKTYVITFWPPSIAIVSSNADAEITEGECSVHVDVPAGADATIVLQNEAPSPQATGLRAAACTRPNEQVVYQINNQDGREALFNGAAYGTPRMQIHTGEPEQLRVIVCGLASPSCGRQPSSPPRARSALPSHDSTTGSPTAAPSLPPKIGPVSIGGRIRVDLSSGYEDVTVSGPLTPQIQPVLLSTDAAEWRWTVHAHSEGTSTLTLAISVLTADSDELLAPSRLFDIEVLATTTPAKKLDDRLTATWNLISSMAGVIAALASIGAFTFAAWLWRRIRRSSPADENPKRHNRTQRPSG